MSRSGPIYTLLAGFALAVFMLTLNATSGSGSTSYGSDAPGANETPSAPTTASRSPAGTATASPSDSPSDSPSASPSKSARPKTEYAGRTDDDSASVAISVNGGKAIAYFCDGRDKESWLKGNVEDDGSMKLSGKHGSKLEGTLRAGKVNGTVELEKRDYPFTARKAVKPSGLYRATSEVRGAKIDGGWIVLQNGRQVGILNRAGKPATAPEINPDTGAVTVDGTQLTARPVAP